MYTIKWTRLQPTEEGWSPPSDTIRTRLLQPNLLVDVVDGRSSVNIHVDLIG